MENNVFIDLVKKEVTPSTGCTEPIAIAYAVAKSKSYLVDEEVLKIDLNLSPNIIKNAMGVRIPGTNQVGIHIAAALGFVAGDANKELLVLDKINPEDALKAKALVEQGKIEVTAIKDTYKLYIDVKLYSTNHRIRTIIAGTHTNIILLQVDDKLLINKSTNCFKEDQEEVPMLISDIYEFITKVDYEDIAFILEGARMNKIIALEGLKKNYGMKVGKTIDDSITKRLMGNDMKNYAVRLAAAGSDARMDGCQFPVMTNSGSGNQGLTVTLPVIAVAEWENKSDEELARALMLSNLVAIHIKNSLGRLSALCGAIVAGIGSSCGMVYLMGGNLINIHATIKNMIGDISGIICDGAKHGCALKVASAVGSAFNAMILSLDNIEITKAEGIIDEDIEKSILNLTLIGRDGMKEMDRMILDIMIAKA